METPGESPRIAANGPQPGCFRVWQLVCWLPVSAILGIFVAWAAVIALGYFAPLVVFPILVGVVLGGGATALLRLLHVGHRPTILLGGLLALGLMIVGEHYFTYRQTHAAYQQAQEKRLRDPESLSMLQVALPDSVPPSNFGMYLQWQAQQGRPIGRYTVKGGWVWASWGLDAVLIAIPAMILIVAAARLPYCNSCQTWYRTIRSGKIDAGTAHRLATLAGVPIPAKLHSARYRLIACRSGCGLSGLALFWEQPDGDFSSGYLWLTASGRNEVQEILDSRPLPTNHRSLLP